MVKELTVAHLYPKQMNVYGDMGNILTLQYRIAARGVKYNYVPIDGAKQLASARPDIIIGGGGQDSNQDLVQADLINNKQLLHNLADSGVVMLMICGMYQLFGHKFIVSEDHQIEGIGVLDIITVAGDNRLIGNVVIESKFGRLVGFENHSGRTTLGQNTNPLGKVVKGAGNNGKSSDEGAYYKNVFGSYLHGPMLAKNPEFADELISRALERRYGDHDRLEEIDDSLELKASLIASRRPR